MKGTIILKSAFRPGRASPRAIWHPGVYAVPRVMSEMLAKRAIKEVGGVFLEAKADPARADVGKARKRRAKRAQPAGKETAATGADADDGEASDEAADAAAGAETVDDAAENATENADDDIGEQERTGE